MEKDIRKIYRFSWPSFSSLLCEECMAEAFREGTYQSCFEQERGTCLECGYQRDENIISKEKALFIENQIKEMKRLMQKVSSSKREVKIDQLIFHRVEKYENLVRGFTDPVNIRQSLQFPITLKKEMVISLIEKHIQNLKLKKEEILN